MCSLLHISTLSLLLRSWISVYCFFFYYYYSLLFCTDIYVQFDGVGGDIYVSHIGMYHPKGKGFLPCFGLKMGIDCSFSSGIGYGFQGNCGSVQTYFLHCFNSK